MTNGYLRNKFCFKLHGYFDFVITILVRLRSPQLYF